MASAVWWPWPVGPSPVRTAAPPSAVISTDPHSGSANPLVISM